MDGGADIGVAALVVSERILLGCERVEDVDEAVSAYRGREVAEDGKLLRSRVSRA